MKIKRFFSLLLAVCMMFSVFFAEYSVQAAEVETQEISAASDIAQTGAETEVADTGANLYGLADNVQDGQILQVWCWSYNNIINNLQKIAEQAPLCLCTL